MKNIFKLKFLAILLLSFQNIQADEIAVIDMRAAVLSTQAASDAFKALEEDADYSINLEQAQSLQAERQALAEKLRDGAKYSIRWTKTSINAGLKVMANSIIDRAAAFENVTQLMEDHKIALEAFAKKEAPKFKQK